MGSKSIHLLRYGITVPEIESDIARLSSFLTYCAVARTRLTGARS
jgi:hypothetical protein